MAKRRRGAPTKYRPEYCEMLIEHMAKPMPYETFGAVVDVNRDTLYQWEKDNKDFSDAKKRGKIKMQQALMEIGLKGMAGQITAPLETTEVQWDETDKNGKPIIKGGKKRTHTVNGFNVTAWIFMMKNMAGWKDRIEISEDDYVDEVTFDGADE